jgi:hypothetical protein
LVDDKYCERADHTSALLNSFSQIRFSSFVSPRVTLRCISAVNVYVQLSIGMLPFNVLMSRLRFQPNAKGGLEEVRGPEVRPLVQSIVFDGKPHKLEIGNNSIAWKQSNPNTFERVLSDGNGTRTLTTRRIRISADGKTMTEETEGKTTDGRTSVDTVAYQRVSGDAQGLVGRWKPMSFKTDNPDVVKYEPAGTNGIKFSDASNMPSDATYTVMLDGKPVAVVGAAVIAGTMTAAKRVDDRTLEFTQSREGVVSGKSVRQVSADGKTLTDTNTTVGPNASAEPSVIVYVKQ